MAKSNIAAPRIVKTPMRTAAAEPIPKKGRKAAQSECVRPLEAVIVETCTVPPIGKAAAADNAGTAEVVGPSPGKVADQGGIEQQVSARSNCSAKPARPGRARQQASSAVRAVDAALVPGPASSGKQARIIEMLRRPEGATNAQLMNVTGWQSHSVRGVLSGVLKRKLGLPVDSTVEPGRGRVYRIGADVNSGVDTIDPAAPTADTTARDHGGQADVLGEAG